MNLDLEVTREGRLTRIIFNRPEQGNGFTDDMTVALTEALQEAPAQSDVILLQANGADFCTGRLRSSTPPATEAYARRTQFDTTFDCYWAMRRSPIPIVSAIQGRCAGFGAAIAALSDVSLASQSATFSIPEMAQHNVMPTMVMSALFDRMSRNAILYMAYSVKPVPADDAMKYGLVSTIVPDADLLTSAQTLCNQIAGYPRAAAMGLKEFLRHAPSLHEHAAIDYARSLHAMVNTSSEMKAARK